ncbi:hypothetical protein FGO68_gene5687 [Halteria grandinella]|uniref:Uncharacterized protein n=1 Tax=Halteria grandinella TaxID=5974 RepID=A0A8J8NUW5_HALGN|nr:hypothetical protein FGO68_gene5687 [Halteria grandinella]
MEQQVRENLQLHQQNSTEVAQDHPRLPIQPQREEEQKEVPEIVAPNFSLEMLNKLVVEINKPQQNYDPKLNDSEQSKLAEHITLHGWPLPLDFLNANSDPQRQALWNEFNGMNQLQNGIYYGQLANGQREGLGVLYCTGSGNVAYLFQCKWKNGKPVAECMSRSMKTMRQNLRSEDQESILRTERHRKVLLSQRGKR